MSQPKLHVADNPAAPIRRTVSRDGYDLAVFEQGNPDGETIVMVHGWPDTHHLWDGVVPQLADRYRVVTYDTRGHGESTVPDKISGFRLEELSKDLFAVLDAVSPDAPVHVLAHDWGSVQAWESVCEPDAHERIASFTSVSGPNLDHLGKWVRARFAQRKFLPPLTQLVSSAYTAFFMTPVLPRLFFGAVGRPGVWRRFLRVLEGTPAAQIHLAPTFNKDSVSGLRIYSANIVQHVLHPRDRHTEVPVQLLVNRRDIAVRPAIYDDADQWCTQLTRIDLKTGHWLPFSNPTLIAHRTAAFIEEVKS
ncbi:alpha/beta fold hydrolase [Tomitella biformata]|uniref:alpha/beta fold hydrolase n=1 Tax=Tomitella biformata TaxID=630403 RepID=UPI0004B92E6D|nr:alpha/beta fold hydrolase [Tomitella biformata]